MRKSTFLLLFLFLSFQGIVRASSNEEERSDTLQIDSQYKEKPPTVNTLRIRAMLRSDFRMERADGVINSNFTVKPAMLQLTGNLGTKLSFQTRYRFDWPAEIQSDGLPLALLMANLSYHITPKISIQVGKMMMMNGSWEFDYNPMEVFIYSLAGSYIQGFQTGAALHVNLGKQSLCYQATKVTENDYHQTGYRNAFNHTLFWMGSLLEDRFRTTYSYTLTNAGKASFLHTIMLGNQLNIGNTRIELDYLNVGALRPYITGQSFSRDQSAIAFVEYRLPSTQLALGVKGIYDLRTKGSEKVTEQWTGSLQLRYHLLPQYGLSIHAVYGFTSPNTPNRYSNLFPDSNNHKLLIGFIWDMSRGIL